MIWLVAVYLLCGLPLAASWIKWYVKQDATVRYDGDHVFAALFAVLVLVAWPLALLVAIFVGDE